MPPTVAGRFSLLNAFSIVTVFVVLLHGLEAAQYVPKPPANAVPTFTKDVAPIFYRNCTTCHRPGQIAPMSLLSYQEARPWAKSIRAQVLAGTMPPWHADPRYGDFENDRRLTPEDRAVVIRWADGGAPRGDPRDLPAPPAYTTDWTIGEPDAVFAMLDDFEVPAQDAVEYQFFEIPTNFTEDKWVQAIEIRPGAPSVVHHAVIQSRGPVRDEPAPAFKLAPGMGPRPGVTRPPRAVLAGDHPPLRNGGGKPIAINGPRAEPIVFNPDTALRIKAGSVLILIMHYMTTGTSVIDRTKIGFKFATAPPAQELLTATLLNQSFAIPPRDPNYAVTLDATTTEDVTLWKIMGHTHLRGKNFEYTAVYPDGRSEIILSVPKYDFNWQTDYVFKHPLKLPKGTRLHVVAHYDNSKQNPWNPDPDAEVRHGEQTWEEMLGTHLAYTVDPPAR